MAASNAPPVGWMDPCVNCLLVPEVATPAPISVDPEVCPMMSLNWISSALNPVVFKLARLLPTTSKAVLFAASPESAVEKDMSQSPFLGLIRSSGGPIGRIRGAGGRRGRLQFLADSDQLLKLAELRQLSDKLDGIGGIGRILILDLGHQQLQEGI